jgi:dCMP deaminase
VRTPASWDDTFMAMARAIAQRSKDPRTQVGCVVVEPGTFHVLSAGYNGFPPRVAETPERWERQAKRDFVIHAELNAICHAKAPLSGSYLYCTLQPCLDCAKAIVAAGICQVVYSEDKPDPKAEALLAEAGVKVRRHVAP